MSEQDDWDAWEREADIMEAELTRLYGPQPWPPPMIYASEAYAEARGWVGGEGTYMLEPDGTGKHYTNIDACHEARALAGCL